LRHKRVAENIKRELAKIIIESGDPRFFHITITSAEVTRDLKYATIYYTSMKDRDAGKALQKAVSYIRLQLAKRIKIRYLPELRFKEDKSFEYGRHIDDIIESIRDKEDKESD